MLLLEKKKYTFNRGGHVPNARLNLQHYLWREFLKFDLHTDVVVPEEAKIADIATGMALWAIEVEQRNLTAIVNGYEVDISHAPPKKWLPSNVTIRKWNIYE